MQHILTCLEELDRIYHHDSLEAYEKTWQTIAQQIQKEFPGFTIAHAEINMSGSTREADGRMTHVLLPMKEQKVKDVQIKESEQTV